MRKETRAYEEKLQLELNIDREEHGKSPFPRRNLKRRMERNKGKHDRS